MGLIAKAYALKAEAARQDSKHANSCCPGMRLVLDYGEKWPEKGPRLVGIQIAHVFERGTGRFKGSPLVYGLPAKGRGKERVEATHIMLEYCPFCGKKT